MKHTKISIGASLSLLCLLIIVPLCSRAQIIVKGQVRDKNGLLPGVSVLLESDMTTGTITDAGGNYTLQVPENDTLVFKAIGYQTKEIAINNQTTVNATMVATVKNLNELVVVGYQTKKLSQVSSSVAVVSGEQLNDVTSNDVSSLLQGKVAGVIVSGTNAGNPSESPSILIRGSSSISAGSEPLIVVDGIIGGTANPNDIKSVTILKDAAATGLYGSRAANGVIIITTKSGRAGKTKIRLNAVVGFNHADFGNLTMMNSQQLYDYEKTFFPSDVFAAERPDSLLLQNTDWRNLAFRTGITQDYTLTISGGSEKTQFYLSGNYYNEEGTLKTTGNEKYNLRANISHEINSKLKVNFKFDGSFAKFTNDASGHYGALNGAINNMPFDNPYNPDGSIMKAITDPGWIGREHDNFLYNWQYNYDRTKRAVVSGDLDLIYTIIPNLTFSSFNRVGYNNSKNELYYDIQSKPGGGTDGRLDNVFNTNSKLITSNRLQYENSFGKHNFNILAVAEAEKNYSDNNDITAFGLPAGLAVIDVASSISDAGGNTSENAFSKGLVQVNYNYNNRYFAVGSFINESSSRFGANHRSANFYTLAGSWILSNEPFMANQNIFYLLKLRASYGSTGNAQIGNYQTLGLYSYSFQYAGFSAAIPSQLANNNLTWEKAKTTNLGLDINMFNRISMSIDVYDKTTNALLLNVPLPYTSGFESVFENVGSVRNRGLEISLTTNNLTGNLKWRTNFNIAFNRNKVLKLYEGKDIISDNQNISVGHDLFSWYMRKWAGVDPQNGDPLWEKVTIDDNNKETVSKTNSYSDATLQFVGTGSPDFTGGINNELSYKGLTLSFFFNFVSGNLLYNADNENYNSDGAYILYNSRVLAKGHSRWKNPGDMATEPKAVYGGNQLSNKPSSRYLEDGSYIRLRNVRLSYQLPNSLLSKIEVDNISIFISGDNLWTGTSFTGMDPEVSLIPGEGIINDNYPISKRILFGINVEF